LHEGERARVVDGRRQKLADVAVHDVAEAKRIINASIAA
jgi:hypothetical protein